MEQVFVRKYQVKSQQLWLAQYTCKFQVVYLVLILTPFFPPPCFGLKMADNVFRVREVPEEHLGESALALKPQTLC